MQYPDSKVHGANMEPTWVLWSPDGPTLAHESYYQGSWLIQCGDETQFIQHTFSHTQGRHSKG